MKLYYSPGACSLGSHIALREAELPFEPVETDIRAKKLADGSDFMAINPEGKVPALGMDDGQVLTENSAILQYIAEQAPAGRLMPADGIGRYRVVEWLAYLSTELHKAFGPLFNPTMSAEIKDGARKVVGEKFDFIVQKMGDGPYLTGENFSAADPYLFAMLGWTGKHEIDLSRWPSLVAFKARIGERPTVQESMRVEGLTQ